MFSYYKGNSMAMVTQPTKAIVNTLFCIILDLSFYLTFLFSSSFQDCFRKLLVIKLLDVSIVLPLQACEGVG